jgi:hypothetical protein
MISALEGLLKKLLENRKHCTSSTLLTVCTAVDLLKELCVTGGIGPGYQSSDPHAGGR